MAKKKLDELFQERFKDFEQMPDDKVWKAIEASLDKKKRRLIPLWWKLGGVAAVLMVAWMVINPFTNSSEDNTPITEIESENKDSFEEKSSKKDNAIRPLNTNEPQLTNTETNSSEKDTLKRNEDYPSKNAASNPKNDLKLNAVPRGERESQVTSTQQEKSKKIKSKELTPVRGTEVATTPDNVLKKGVGQEDSPQHLNKISQEELVQQDSISKSIINKSEEEMVVQREGPLNTEKDIGQEIEDTAVVQNDEKQNDVKPGDDINEEGQKKSIFDEIEKQEEELVVEGTIQKRWSIGPSIAPVYFDAFGEGSPVNPIFVSNTKSGETNLSYGLSVTYDINGRLSIRSGLHKVDYGYDTRDIEFASSLDGAVTEQLDNIDYATTAGNLVVRSNMGDNTLSVDSGSENAFDPAFDFNGDNASTPRAGAMTQQFGYLEVPLELNYNLIDSKIGLNLIGGLSSLFLVDNSVSLRSGNETTQIGKANNINNVNFSTNIGLGIDYNFTSKVKLNIEPIFKYQLNTFSEVDGTFNPFSVGIYSGLTFKF